MGRLFALGGAFLMPKPSSRRAHAWARGHEPGSVYASLTPAQQKAFKRWMESKAADARAFERGLRGTAKSGRSARSLYGEV